MGSCKHAMHNALNGVTILFSQPAPYSIMPTSVIKLHSKSLLSYFNRNVKNDSQKCVGKSQNSPLLFHLGGNVRCIQIIALYKFYSPTVCHFQRNKTCSFTCDIGERKLAYELIQKATSHHSSFS